MKPQTIDFNLATVIDQIRPYGCLMAGDGEQDAPLAQEEAGESGSKIN